MKIFVLLLLMTAGVHAQQGRVELRSVFSPTLSTMKQYNIYLPEGYDVDSDHYPVLYLFRGAVDEWVDPNEDNSRRGTIVTVYDSLIAKKKIGKMILVMPSLGAPAPQIEYTYLINDLIPHIDGQFRTIPGRWHRAADGFSLGGLIVTNLLASVPSHFTSIGSYDGTLSLFNNSPFINASPSFIYTLRQVQLLYHTASVGGNNFASNTTTFNVLNGKGIFNHFPSLGLHPNAQHNWYYADWHMGITMPLHWQNIHSAANSLHLTFSPQPGGTIFSGTGELKWSRTIVPDSVTTHLFYSKNNGKNWTKFFTTTGNDSVVQWNTLPLSDGTRYRLKIISASDTLFGSVISEPFTVNNPGNGAPDVEIAGLSNGDTISGTYNLQWYAGDADGDALNITIHISHDGGTSWNQLVSSIVNSGNYLFNTRFIANGNNVRFRITADDGTVSSQTVSPIVILHNKRIPLLNASFQHLTGTSDAIFAAVGMSADSLRDANYTITFSESEGIKRYSVVDRNNHPVVTNATELDGTTEGPLFNGFRLLIQDFPTPIVNVDASRWITGTSPLLTEIKLIDIVTDTGTVAAKPFPADYEIRVHNTVRDTTLSMFGAIGQPVNFQVWNTTLNRPTKVIFVELDGNGSLSRNDELYFVEFDSLKNPTVTWHVQFVGNETDVPPVSGDKYFVKIMKPLTVFDTYQFIFYPALSVDHGTASPDQYSLAHNFPNPFNPSTAIRFSIPHRSVVTLTVTDILGRTVQTLLNKSLDAGVHTVDWNASAVASGIYFYRLTAGIFSETKKMLLTK